MSRNSPRSSSGNTTRKPRTILHFDITDLTQPVLDAYPESASCKRNLPRQLRHLNVFCTSARLKGKSGICNGWIVSERVTREASMSDKWQLASK
jgi:hypothetical protein